MTLIHSTDNHLHVTIGAEPMNLEVEGVFVRNGISEINTYINTKGREQLEQIVAEKGAVLEEQIALFNQNAHEQRALFNQNAEEQKSYVLEDVTALVSGDLEACPTGSAKYWASQAKINYEEALLLADTLNGEEI